MFIIRFVSSPVSCHLRELKGDADDFQCRKDPEPSSWLNVFQRARNGFFSHGRLNPYGEKWEGPVFEEYEPSWKLT